MRIGSPMRKRPAAVRGGSPRLAPNLLLQKSERVAVAVTKTSFQVALQTLPALRGQEIDREQAESWVNQVLLLSPFPASEMEDAAIRKVYIELAQICPTIMQCVLQQFSHDHEEMQTSIYDTREVHRDLVRLLALKYVDASQVSLENVLVQLNLPLDRQHCMGLQARLRSMMAVVKTHLGEIKPEGWMESETEKLCQHASGFDPELMDNFRAVEKRVKRVGVIAALAIPTLAAIPFAINTFGNPMRSFGNALACTAIGIIACSLLPLMGVGLLWEGNDKKYPCDLLFRFFLKRRKWKRLSQREKTIFIWFMGAGQKLFAKCNRAAGQVLDLKQQGRIAEGLSEHAESQILAFFKRWRRFEIAMEGALKDSEATHPNLEKFYRELRLLDVDIQSVFTAIDHAGEIVEMEKRF